MLQHITIIKIIGAINGLSMPGAHQVSRRYP